MISIQVDEAYAYDMLAISSIKRYHSPNSYGVDINHARLTKAIVEQVGDNKHLDVVSSREYMDLYKVNAEMYIRIDELKERGELPGDALYIDSRVYQRFLAKRALQERWFPEQPLTEQKMGYKKA